MGVTFDILKSSGTFPVNTDSLYITAKGLERVSLASLISLLGIFWEVLFSFRLESSQFIDTFMKN